MLRRRRFGNSRRRKLVLSVVNFLKRLELQGFKSFAGKTVLDFPSRVVAIVGPNGSGKSNIIDAFRWVLGEREAKQLRGDTLDKLIFSGTPKRAAVGVAKVGLTFDNRSRMFPVDGEEVEVTRRIDRSGVSEFSCQDAEIKLKELVPLLARARLGSRGLNMVGQGQSDVFVKSSPEERRFMIEEMLGLKEFRLKKNQAERQLEASTANMEKATALLEEIAPHLRILRRQKHRWDKRSEIAETLRSLEDHYFSSRFHSLRGSLEKIETPLRNLGDVRKEKEKEISTLEKKLGALDAASTKHEEAKRVREQITKLIGEQTALERERARVEARLEFRSETKEIPHSPHELREMIVSFRDDVAHMLDWNELEKIVRSLRSWLERLDEFLKAKGAEKDGTLEEEKRKFDEKLAALEKNLHALRKQEEELASVEEEKNREFRAEVQRLEALKNELRRMDGEMQTLMLEKERFLLQTQDLEREWELGGRPLAELKMLPKTEGEVEIGEAQRKIMRLRGELAALGEIDEGLVKEADETEKRHEFLTKELEDLTRASKDLKKVIEEVDERIHNDFKKAFRSINEAFNDYFRLMFGGGRAHLKLEIRKLPELVETASNAEEAQVPETPQEPKEVSELHAGVEIDLQLPRKRITSLDMLSGGEKSLVSLAALFALISVSPPPFLVLDEIDAALDDENARRFAELIREFSKKTQFVVVTHNRSTMEAADILYGITMGDDGVSKVLSLKLE